MRQCNIKHEWTNSSTANLMQQLMSLFLDGPREITWSVSMTLWQRSSSQHHFTREPVISLGSSLEPPCCMPLGSLIFTVSNRASVTTDSLKIRNAVRASAWRTGASLPGTVIFYKPTKPLITDQTSAEFRSRRWFPGLSDGHSHDKYRWLAWSKDFVGVFLGRPGIAILCRMVWTWPCKHAICPVYH